jgi:hypothetical protein
MSSCSDFGAMLHYSSLQRESQASILQSFANSVEPSGSVGLHHSVWFACSSAVEFQRSLDNRCKAEHATQATPILRHPKQFMRLQGSILQAITNRVNPSG